jgi:hypothetical protein
MSTKMHRKVLSWQDNQLSFDNHYSHGSEDECEMFKQESFKNEDSQIYVYTNEMLKLPAKSHQRDYLKEYRSNQNSPKQVRIDQTSIDYKERKKWLEYDRKANEPALIAILRTNQDIHDKIPDTPKKSLAGHLKKKALARFKDSNISSNKKELLERRRKITEQMEHEADKTFLRPSLDPSSKYYNSNQ